MHMNPPAVESRRGMRPAGRSGWIGRCSRWGTRPYPVRRSVVRQPRARTWFRHYRVDHACAAHGGPAGSSSNLRPGRRLRQQSSRVPPPERNPRRLNPRNQTAFGRSRSIGSDAGAGWAPECALHLLHAQKATRSPPLSASISRASSGSATSEPSSSTMCRIFATCWALDSAS